MKQPPVRRSVAFSVLVAVVALSASGCGSDDNGGGGKTKLVVFAASSLTETFTTMEKGFEKAHPDVDVVTSFDSSSTLVGQIQNGAKADVMATADEESMQPLVDKGDVKGAPTTFGTNQLIVVTPKDNPGHVTGLDSLSKVNFVVCDPSAPCGNASKQILASAGITAKPKSLEENVKSVLAKVTSGAADAGLVYVTDAKASADQVQSFSIPDSENVTTKDLIAVVKGSKHADLAQQWLDYVTSSAGQQILKKASFGSPSAA
jgi:molybdate transport system substrate-binding protein